MKIWVDLDEVLAQFLDAFLAYHNDTYHTDYKVEDAFSYDFREVRGGTRDEIIEKVRDFHQTHYFTNIKPVEWALSVLQKLSENHELYIITARQNYVQEQTRTRVDNHFPNIFNEIFFMNHFSTEWESRKKGDVCNEIGVSVMIDDSLIYAEDCLIPERKVVLYKRPWNENKSINPAITVVKSRNEIDSLI